MTALTYVQLLPENEEMFESAKTIWLPFIKEVNSHDEKTQDDCDIELGLRKRIGIQGRRKDMHFELAFCDGLVVGIAMFAIDLGTIGGLLEQPGYGTIMGFYIKPEYRRKGYGRLFYKHIEKSLAFDGAPKIYLCPDSVTGVPFWQAMGFEDSGKFDPDDKKPIFIKSIHTPVIT